MPQLHAKQSFMPSCTIDMCYSICGMHTTCSKPLFILISRNRYSVRHKELLDEKDQDACVNVSAGCLCSVEHAHACIDTSW